LFEEEKKKIMRERGEKKRSIFELARGFPMESKGGERDNFELKERDFNFKKNM